MKVIVGGAMLRTNDVKKVFLDGLIQRFRLKGWLGKVFRDIRAVTC